jgi:hypothetical protein
MQVRVKHATTFTHAPWYPQNTRPLGTSCTTSRTISRARATSRLRGMPQTMTSGPTRLRGQRKQELPHRSSLSSRRLSWRRVFACSACELRKWRRINRLCASSDSAMGGKCRGRSSSSSPSCAVCTVASSLQAPLLRTLLLLLFLVIVIIIITIIIISNATIQIYKCSAMITSEAYV